MIYLISYPRSGNTFLRYVIEYLSGRPTLGCKGSEADTPIYKRVDGLKLTSSIPIARKSHWWKDIDKEICENEDSLILLVRDYKESIIRHTYNVKIDTDYSKLEQVNKYIKPFVKFDNYCGPKVIIYYECIITNIEKVINKLGRIIEFEKDPKKFYDDIDYHRNKALSCYFQKSHTKGKTVSYHKKTIKAEDLEKWDQLMEETSPEIYKKYLEHYKE